MPTPKQSGSAKISDQRGSFSPADVKRLTALLTKLKAKPDILVNGIPKPDWLKGSFAAPSSAAAAQGILELLKLGGTFKPVKLFPKGIPVIDQVMVEFDVRAR